MKKIITLILAYCICNTAFAQLILSSAGTPELITFTGFDGSGFSDGPSDGQLSSNTWSVEGFSDGDIPFGGEGITGDFARGTTSGFVTTGGIYAADIFGNQRLMVQPGSDDFTPGSFILRLQNTTGITLGQLDISYTLYALNDEERANSFNLSYSADNITYTDAPAFDFTSPEVADDLDYYFMPSSSITGISIPDGSYFYIRWTGNDVSGSGSRDEFVLDDISITGYEGAAVPVYNFSPSSLTVEESAGVAYYDITLSETADCTFNVGYEEVTADLPTDFGFTSFTVTFTEGGPTTQTIDVGIVDDIEDEPLESFKIFYTVASGTCIAGPNDTVEIFIESDDAAGTAGASFDAAGLTADESIGTFSVGVQLTEEADCTLSVDLDAASTMTEGSDYILDLPILLTFNVGGSTMQVFDVMINDDPAVETDETLIMNLSVLSGTCALVSPSGYDIIIHDNDGPVYTPVTVADVHGEDADGVCTNIGDMVSLTGIVYGINIWDGGLQFTLIDETAGISVFSFDQTYGYTVTEGDKITVNGEIDQFNGLTEIIPDTILVISSGNPLNSAVDISVLDETTESQLVLIDNLSIVELSQWVGDGSSFNVDFTDGSNIYAIRIDNNTDLASTPFFLDTDHCTIKGLGSQFDTESPYAEGYQLMPRYMSDLECFTQILDIKSNPVKIYPNPTTDYLTILAKENIETIEIINQIGEIMKIVAIDGQEKTVDIKDFQAGFYALKIYTESGIFASSFIKQ